MDGTGARRRRPEWAIFEAAGEESEDDLALGCTELECTPAGCVDTFRRIGLGVPKQCLAGVVGM